MISNAELFRKMMMASRTMRMDLMKNVGERPFHHGPHGMHGPMHGPMHCMPPVPPAGMPPMPPHGCGGPGRKHGPSRERLLVIISECPEGIRQKALAEQAGINTSSASELISRLEDDGYLIRTIDESDKRATLLKLTEMGSVRAEEIKAEREEAFKDIFADFTEEEKQTLSALLDKILA